jgi:hypothetical protein
MKSNQKSFPAAKALTPAKSSASSTMTAMAISKKLLEIKRISGAGEMTEMNMALWKHLK